jgi:hypothetical protein
MGRGWFGVVCVGARSSFGECGVCLWACVFVLGLCVGGGSALGCYGMIMSMMMYGMR